MGNGSGGKRSDKFFDELRTILELSRIEIVVFCETVLGMLSFPRVNPPIVTSNVIIYFLHAINGLSFGLCVVDQSFHCSLAIYFLRDGSL